MAYRTIIIEFGNSQDFKSLVKSKKHLEIIHFTRIRRSKIVIYNKYF